MLRLVEELRLEVELMLKDELELRRSSDRRRGSGWRRTAASSVLWRSPSNGSSARAGGRRCSGGGPPADRVNGDSGMRMIGDYFFSTVAPNRQCLT